MKKTTEYLTIFILLVIFFLQIQINSIKTETEEQFGRDGKYDFHPVLMNSSEAEKLGSFIKELPLLQAKFKIKILPNNFGVPENEEKKVRAAVGIFMGGYILTVAHFTENPTYSAKTSSGSVPLSVKIKERKIFIITSEGEIELREIKIDYEQDWALFKMPDNLIGKYLFPEIGKSNKLRPGHFLYFMGHPYYNGILLRSGIVEAENFGIKDSYPNIKKEDVFAMSGGLYPGDSGGPVFALRDGKLELVGIMKGTRLYTNIGHALKIGPILEKIKAATGIDLITIDK